MVPKLHAKGKSFRGAAAYLLHDKDRAETAERVEWTEVRNLATDNPHVAWKVMAATAMDQDRLKAQAGVKKTGRKSLDSVLHFTLSWHPDEEVDREEMKRAAQGAIKALQAADRQAMIISHSDEPHKHIHVLLNRVSPEDGKMLSSSKEKLALSAWAEAYEKERGEIYCEERVINNEARKRNEYTRGEKDKARHLLEAEGPRGRDASPEAKAARDRQREREALIARKARAVQERQRGAWAKFQEAHKQSVREIRAQAVRDTATQKTAVRERFRPDWTMLHHERQAQMSEFMLKEKSLLGRVQNALRQIDYKAIINGQAQGEDGRSRRQALSESFKVLSSAGARLEALKRQQERERRQLEIRQRQAEAQAARDVSAGREIAMQESRAMFERGRNDLILEQSMDGAKLRAERKARNEQRNEENFRSDGRVLGPAVQQEIKQQQGNGFTLVRKEGFKPEDDVPGRDQLIQMLRERRRRNKERNRDRD